MNLRRTLSAFHRVVLLLLCTASTPLFASLEQQRINYLAAEQAFAQGRLADYRHLAGKLTDYPLYPYLRYNRLQRGITPERYAEIKRFLQEYKDLPIADRLRDKWLTDLARNRQWQHYLASYQPSMSVKLQCHYYHSLLVNGRQSEAWRGAEQLWLHGKSRPSACDSLFNAWRSSDQFSAELVWKRLMLSLEAGQTRLARFLKGLLPVSEQPTASRLINLHLKPEQVASCDLWNRPELADIAAYGLRRLSRRNADAALQLWQQRGGLPLADETRQQTLNRLALESSLAGIANAGDFLDSLPADVLDETLAEWRLRWALARGSWGQVASWYEQLPELSRESTRWRYWQASAVQELGDEERATAIFRELASQRDYYGFLAADRLGLPYQLNRQEIPVSEADLRQLEQQPAVKRIVELRHFSRETDARREWWHLVNRFEPPQRAVAAKLAQRWGWHSIAILTAASAKAWDDVELRFPVTYDDIVLQQATEQQLQPELLFGLIRRESVFDPSARSRVGALGLMQLMPATGRRVAKSRREKLSSSSRLLQPELNVRYGSHYLRQMLDRFDGDPVLALAAYNGGPHNVDRWLRKMHSVPADLWTEMITYGETRDYVQAVLSYAMIYRRLADNSNAGKGSGETLRLADVASRINLPSGFDLQPVGKVSRKAPDLTVKSCD